MRILLDEQLPRQLRHHFGGHQVRTVRQQGWTGLRNGQLLICAAAAGFDIFVTADRSLQFQQNIAVSPLGFVILAAQSNSLEDLVPLLPALLNAVREVRPGEIRRIDSP